MSLFPFLFWLDLGFLPVCLLAIFSITEETSSLVKQPPCLSQLPIQEATIENMHPQASSVPVNFKDLGLFSSISCTYLCLLHFWMSYSSEVGVSVFVFSASLLLDNHHTNINKKYLNVLNIFSVWHYTRCFVIFFYSILATSLGLVMLALSKARRVEHRYSK